MSLWRSLRGGIRVLFRPTVSNQELDDEIGHYYDEAVADAMARGMTADEAHRQARVSFGAPIAVREQVRAAGWERLLDTTLQDLRYAARGLRANPLFTVVVILTFALGIGASTTIFSAVKPVLFEPLPYPDPGRIVAVWDRARDGSPLDITFGTYREVLLRSRSFSAVAAMKPWQPTLTGSAEPERLEGQRVSAPYFRALGVRPAIGRDFVADDDTPAAPGVVVISDGLWRRRFGADPQIVGRTVTLSDAPFAVVGVMPARFENVLLPAAEVWTTLQYDPAVPQDGREWGHHLQAVARIAPPQLVDAAAAELDTIARQPISGFPRAPWAALAQGFIVRPLHDDVTGDVRPALVAVLAAVLLVLGAACVNVTNLLLARSAHRTAEFAMRAALGASRVRLVAQLLVESLLLASLGGLLGVGAAHAGVRALVALSPMRLPRLDAISVDRTVLLVAIVVTSIAGIAVGLAPAFYASRTDAALRTASRSVAGGHRRARTVLVVAEVALAIVLLVSAGLLVRSLQRLFAIDTGFDPAHLLTMQVQASTRQFSTADALHRFFDRALESVRRLPGVKSAAFTTQVPLSGDFEKYGTRFESSPTETLLDDHSALRYAVSPGYLETMAIPLKRGRTFTDRDRAASPPVAIINESFARRRFPASDPIGQRLHLGRTDVPWMTIVGVVGNITQTSPALPQSDAVYIPAAQWYAPDRVRSLVVRTTTDPAALTAAIRQAIWAVDKDQPIVRVSTMDAMLMATEAQRRFAMMLFEAFAAAALVLAAIGIYGVLSGTVAERVREIGVRAALGASRGDILRLIMRQGLGTTLIGIGCGVAAATVASRALVSLLFGVSHLDPVTYAAMAALLTTVAAAACGLPAWRASRIDPSITLRAQ